MENQSENPNNGTCRPELTSSEPVSRIKWIHTNRILPNEYNPNVVFNKELELLEFSILKNGWVHPLILNTNPCDQTVEMDGANRSTFTIIDGFHRYSLSCMSKKLEQKYWGWVPAVVLDLPEPERMLLTIRINRAKGTHMAYKMADIIKKLMDDHKLTSLEIGEAIGANQDEVKLLYENSIFNKLDLQKHKYNKAWHVKEKK